MCFNEKTGVISRAAANNGKCDKDNEGLNIKNTWAFMNNWTTYCLANGNNGGG